MNVLRAARTALGEVPGGTAVSVESERDGARWEVEIVTDDGTEREVIVSGDGNTVIDGPTAKHGGESDQAEHRARVQAAELDHEQAVRTVLEPVPNGTVTGIDIARTDEPSS